jgi:chorismate dehydratase
LIFSKIEYLNLLPFNVFTKKNLSLRFNQIANYKKTYPSKINRAFKKRQIDGAFISSIYSNNCQCSDIGIVAHKEVLSVFVDKSKKTNPDFQSDTSNALSKILDLNGEVIIGDKALKIYFGDDFDESRYCDLASLWYEKYKLPFVFARLCFTSHNNQYKKISKKFSTSKINIPQYILKKEALRVGIKQNEAKYYLTKIKYSLDYKSKKSLKLFLNLTRIMH